MKKVYVLTFLLFALCMNVVSQQVSTILNSSSFQIDDAITQDRNGNIYGSHYMGSRIYKITPSGQISIFTSGLNTPNGLAFNSQDQLYVVDNIGNKILKYDINGLGLDTIIVSNPSGIIKSIDSDTMIITQYTGHTVRKLAPDGTLAAIISRGSPLNGPVGLCYGSDSLLYIGNFTDRRIFKINRQQQLVYVARVPGSNGSSLGFITQAGGMIYGTAFQNNKIYEVDPNFQDSVRLLSGSTAGNLNGSLATARFNGPNGIYASRGGDSLLISDFNTGNVRLISGLITSLKEYKQNSYVQLYPNPSKGLISIIAQDRILFLQVYNLQGKLVLTKNEINQTKYEFNHDLERGTYLLRIQTEDTVIMKKLIVNS